MKKTVIFAVFSSFAISGCAALGIQKPRAQVEKLGKADNNQAESYIATFDATSRASVIHVNPDGTLKVLAEVAPDAVITSVSEVLGKLNYGDGKNSIGAEAQAKVAESVTTLGKRTAAVNILRDALYRLQEMKQNGALSDDEKALFQSVLDAAVKIAIAEEIENKTKFFSEVNKAAETLKGAGASDAEVKSLIQNSLIQ